jgi:hypothetical protein
MRFAMIAVAVVVASSPSQASPSCMTQAEARQKLGAVHLYWHGPNHCWDATPSRRRLAQRARTRERQQVERDVAQEKQEIKQEKKFSREDRPQRWAHEPRWREAMSKMLPDDALPLREAAQERAGSVTFDAPPPRMNWRDRWVDVAQRAPPVLDKVEPADLAADAGYTVEPMVTPTRVMLALLAVLLMLAVIELLFRTTIRGWRS